MASQYLQELDASAALIASYLIPVSNDPAGTGRLKKATFTQLVTFLSDNAFSSLGIGISPVAKFHVIGTTEQIRLGYDASNYYSTTIGSTGGVTFNAVGAGAGFTFSDPVVVSTLNGNTITTGTGTLTIAAGKTATFSNTLTFAGTDSSTLNIGTGGTLGTAAYTASSAYEVPLTFSTGLTRTTNTITVNTSQNIATLSNLTSDGLITTSGGNGTLSVTSLDTDGTLAANSDSRVATQKATKTYVDTMVTGLLDFKGSTDCSTNPNYPSASKGDAYYVSVAGKIGGASGTSVEIGDVYVASADNAGGTQASVGTSWFTMEHNLVGAAVTSGTLAQFAATTSAQLLSVLSDETGTGLAVFNNTPTLIAPLLGTPTSGILTNCTGTATGLTAGQATILATGRTIAITGDLTYTSSAFNGSANVTAAGTLATVNANVGSFGSSTSIPTFTVNGKGLITAASGNAVIAPAGTLTGTTLAATVVTSSLTSVGTITTGVWTGTTIALANGGTGQITAYAAQDALSVKGANIASATTTNLATATGDFVDVTGTVTITGLGTASAGVERTIRFTNALILTHNATSLILPGASNITTIANDIAVFRSLGSGNWICIDYVRASNIPSSGTNTGDQTITLTGDVTGSGTGSFVTTIAAGAVDNAMLAGSIAASKLVGTDIVTVGTITSGTWSGTAIDETKGGTGATTYALGDILYSSATNTLAKLAGNITTTKMFLNQTGNASISAAPTWAALVNADIPTALTGKSYNGLTLTSTTGTLTLASGSSFITSGAFATTLTVTGTTGLTLPTTGTLATTAQITVADTTDTTCYVGLYEASTGVVAPKTDGGLTYNATTGMLTATGLTGPLTGNASTATILDNARTIAITGDLTYTSPSFDGSANVTAAGTLATVNATVGSFGSSTSIPTFTVNAKGLITAASGNVVIAPAGTVTGTTLNATVVTSSLTAVGTITTGTWSATTVAVNKGGTGQTSYTDGQLLIGNTTGNTLAKGTLTAGTGVTVTNGAGSITVAASTNIDVQDFTSNGTWTKPTNGTIKSVQVIMIGGGGGGGSGRRGVTLTTRCGGGGGAGGGYLFLVLDPSVLGATESVVVGAGGAGGAAQTVNTTNGNVGTVGGNTTFSGYNAVGGNFGRGGGSTATTAGGALASNSIGGPVVIGTPSSAGGNGGSAATDLATDGDSGTGSIKPTGGGGGGGISSANVIVAGGAGGTMGDTWRTTPTAGGTAGPNTGTAAARAGGAGSAYSTVDTLFSGLGGGGGGGGDTAGTIAGGAGGAGGNYGSGGGGGGASANGANSGIGGAGAGGFVRVITEVN